MPVIQMFFSSSADFILLKERSNNWPKSGLALRGVEFHQPPYVQPPAKTRIRDISCGFVAAVCGADGGPNEACNQGSDLRPAQTVAGKACSAARAPVAAGTARATSAESSL